MSFELSGSLSLVQTLAQRYVEPILQDGVLRNDPLAAMLKRKCLCPYKGGPGWQLNSTYDTLQVINVPKSGVQFDPSVNSNQLEMGYQFDIRSKIVPIPIDLGLLTTDLWGQNVNLDYLETRLQSAALSMSAKIATDAYKDGQNVSGVDNTLAMNGLDEALQDGTNAGWQGRTFTTYGTVSRASAQGGDPIKSLMTGPTASLGSVNYGNLEDFWMSQVFGDEQPDYWITTNKGYSILKRTINPAVRLEQKSDQEYGFTSFAFNGTSVYFSQYAPGSRAASTVDTKVGYVGGLSGETLFSLNTKYLRFYVSQNPMKAFSLWEFVRGQNNQQAVAQYVADVNLVVTPGTNRYMRQAFAITD